MQAQWKSSFIPYQLLNVNSLKKTKMKGLEVPRTRSAVVMITMQKKAKRGGWQQQRRSEKLALR